VIAPYRIGLLASVLVGAALWWTWRKRRSEERPALA
jgi:hypothetical protein